MRPLDPRLLRRSAVVRRHLVACVGLGAVAAATIVATAAMVATIVDRRFEGRDLGVAAVVVAALLVGRGLTTWTQGVVSARAAARVQADLRVELVDDLLDGRRAGDRPGAATVVTLLGPGIGSFDAYVGRFVPQVALTAVVPVAVVGSVWVVDPLSGAILTLTVPLVVGFLALVGLATADRVAARWSTLTRLGRHFADVLDAAVVLKVLGRRSVGVREVGEQHRVETMHTLRSAFVSSLVLELFSTLSVALVAVTVGLRLVHGGLGLGDALFVLLLAPEAFAPVRRLGAQFHDSATGAEAVATALDLLDHPRHDRRRRVGPAGTTDLEVRDLLVEHADRTRPSLDLAQAVVPCGRITVLSGPSGSGKSTLLGVLTGLVAPTAGDVHVDGVPLAEVDLDAWRAGLAWVPQHPTLLHGTVADNVRLGASAASTTDLRRALDDVGGAHLALDRQVGDEGSALSVGERRRVALARAVVRVRVHGASLVLLDEPTAGLDRAAEQRALTTVSTLGVTVLMVAHRAAALDIADHHVDLTAATVLA